MSEYAKEQERLRQEGSRLASEIFTAQLWQSIKEWDHTLRQATLIEDDSAQIIGDISYKNKPVLTMSIDIVAKRLQIGEKSFDYSDPDNTRSLIEQEFYTYLVSKEEK